MNNEQEYDDVFLTPEEADIQIPDSTNSWKTVQRKLAFQRRKILWFRLIRRSALILVAFVAGAALFGTPMVTTAFSPFWIKIQQIEGDVTTLVFGRTEGGKPSSSTVQTEPAKGGQNVIGSVIKRPVTWEEAKKACNFSLPAIGFVPNGYHLREIVVLHSSSDMGTKVRGVYESKSDQTITIVFSSLAEETLLYSNSHYNDWQSSEKLYLFEHSAFLNTSNDGSRSLEFMKDGVAISISGKLPAEVVLDMAKQLK
jgi:hypothetical protein